MGVVSGIGSTDKVKMLWEDVKIPTAAVCGLIEIMLLFTALTQRQG
jgi:hypothetical protein